MSVTFMRRLIGSIALLGIAACTQAKVEPKPKPEVVAQLELRVAAPGMAPEHVEQQIVLPIELALVGNSDVREIVSEAGEGQARMLLSLSNRAELVAVDVLQRVTKIQPQLPEDIGVPTLRPLDLNPRMLHFALVQAHGEDVAALLRDIEAIAGVLEVKRCGLDQVITIELDPEALRRMSLGVVELERELHSGLLLEKPTAIDELAGIVITHRNGRAVRLADLATVRLEPATHGCEAWSEQGRAVGISVALRHDEARERVAAQLQAGRERGLAIHSPASRLHVWLKPGLEHEDVAQEIRNIAGPQWVLEIGVEPEPCAGPGTLARVHLPEGAAIGAISNTLAALPGVVLVERADAPRTRQWLFGPDGEQARNTSDTIVLDEDQKPELAFHLDREKLAALGLDHETVSVTLALAMGREIGRMLDGGQELPVQLRLGSGTDDPAKLAALSLPTPDGKTVPLSTVAELREEVAPARICRRNGERGIVVLGDDR